MRSRARARVCVSLSLCIRLLSFVSLFEASEHGHSVGYWLYWVRTSVFFCLKKKLVMIQTQNTLYSRQHALPLSYGTRREANEIRDIITTSQSQDNKSPNLQYHRGLPPLPGDHHSRSHICAGFKLEHHSNQIGWAKINLK